MDEEKTNNEEKIKDIKEEKPNKKSKKAKILKFLKNLLKVIVLIIIIGATFIIGVKYSDSFKHEAYSQEIGFKNVGELVTQSAFLRIIEDSSDDRKLFEKTILPTIKVPFTESRKIFSYLVQVDASINFEEIVINNIDDEAKTIYLKLPHAKVRQPSVIYDSFKSHLDSESLFSRIDSTELNELFKEMEKEAVNEAIANGIIELADKNGRNLIENFIKTYEKYKDYKIEYEYIEGE